MALRSVTWTLAGAAALLTVVVSYALRPQRLDPASESVTLRVRASHQLDDEDLPGFVVHPTIFSVTDVASLGTGWVILDRQASSVHLLDEDLSLVRSFGREGDGPGEMSRPAQVAVLGDSVIGVLERPSLRLHVFAADGRFLKKVEPRIRGCFGSVTGDLLPGSGDSFVVAGPCPGFDEVRWIAADVSWRDGRTTRIKDVVAPGGRSILAGTLGWSMIRFQGRFFVGRPDGCFHPVADSGAAAVQGPAPPPAIPDGVALCVPERDPVPIPDSLGLGDIELPTPPQGWSLEAPTHFPPVLDAQWSPAGTMLLMPDLAFEDAAALLKEDGTLTVIRSPHVFHPGPDRLLMSRTLLDGMGFRTIRWSELR